MKNIIYLSIIFFALSGCANDFEAQPEGVICDSFEVAVNAATPSTRTTIDGTTLSWVAGDKIAVFADGLQYNRQFSCTNPSTEMFTGRFIVKNQTQPSINYYAYSPFVFQETNLTTTTINTILPTNQVAPFDSSADFMIANPVLAAYNETNFTSVGFEFANHLFSIVRVTVKNTKAELQNEKLMSVSLLAPGQVLSGAFSFDVTTPTAAAQFSTTPSELSNRVEATYPEASQPILGLGVEHVIYLVVKPTSEPITSLTMKVKTSTYISEFNSNVNVSLSAGKVTTLPTVDVASVQQTNRVRKIVLWGDSVTSATFLSAVKQILGNDWEVIRGGIPGDVSLSIAARQGGIPMVTGTEFTLPATKNTPVYIDGLYATQDQLGQSSYTKVGNAAWYATGNCSLINPCLIAGVECNVKMHDTKGIYIERLTDGEQVVIPTHSNVTTYAARAYKDADLIVIYMGANGGGHGTYEVLRDQHQAMIEFTTKKEAIVLGFNIDISLQWGTTGYWSIRYVELFTQAFNRNFIDMRTVGSQNATKLLMQTEVISSPQQMSQADLDAVAIGDWPESFFTSSSDNVHPNAKGSHAMALLLRDRMEELGYFN